MQRPLVEAGQAAIHHAIPKKGLLSLLLIPVPSPSQGLYVCRRQGALKLAIYACFTKTTVVHACAPLGCMLPAYCSNIALFAAGPSTPVHLISSTAAARAPLSPVLLHVIPVTFAARAPLLPVHYFLISGVLPLMICGCRPRYPRPGAWSPALGIPSYCAGLYSGKPYAQNHLGARELGPRVDDVRRRRLQHLCGCFRLVHASPARGAKALQCRGRAPFTHIISVGKC